MNRGLPYPPPYQDLAALARHLCAGESTIEQLVALGQFPRPRMMGGKRVWKWLRLSAA
jgi:predicted DNA-binding transcriptional regulator AlpA